MKGYAVDAELVLMDDMAGPNATTKDSTNMIPLREGMEIRVYVEDELALAAADTLSIALETYSDDTAASAANPIYDNSSGWACSAQFIPFSKIATAAAMKFSAGKLLTAFAIPTDFLIEHGGEIRRFGQMKITSNKNLSTIGFTAFARQLM